ncbi:putative membrane protein [Comamonas sp. BIGb0152]|uniref:TPM domain-containing protein n=1 Tax=Comamonas sp. BIGb0152 TaxID=2940601 RepID=UPI00216986A2|nr:TPM domain-containing protein [Comamonas sp. BIGb0152]MCS4296188.1 putative membrane protein [Comamonas sp. BIGb0152]
MGHWLQRWGRQLRHRFLERDASHALPDDARQRLAQAIAASEAKHSGQIRVYVESALPWSYIRRDAPARERAVMQFGKQRVWDTEHNNGVLIYLLLTDHAIEIVADRAVSRCVSGPQWQAMVESLATDLRSGQYEKALLAAIGQVSRHLEQQFPRSAQSPATDNELDDNPLVG